MASPRLLPPRSARLAALGDRNGLLCVSERKLGGGGKSDPTALSQYSYGKPRLGGWSI